MSLYGDDQTRLINEGERDDRPCWKKPKFICPLLFTIGCLGLGLAIGLCAYKNSYHDVISFRLMSLNTWGMPYKLGALDKEARMIEIGKKIAKQEYDVYLLEELWMKPDHATIKSFVPEGWYMTETYELGVSGACDGKILPTGCSGLAIVSRYPFQEVNFHEFSVSGDFFWNDGEYFAKKGVGHVRIEPQPNVTVDVYVTHTAASDYNSYYREIQTKEVVDLVKSSTADFAIVGGDFNIDPRMTNETTYQTLTAELKNSMHEFFYYIEECLNPARATYANPVNSYSSDYKDGPQLYDYILHKTTGWNAIVTNIFDVPYLKANIFRDLVTDDSSENRRRRETKGSPVTVSLSDHEAVTASLLLFKSKYV